MAFQRNLLPLSTGWLEAAVSLKHQYTSSRLHGITSHKPTDPFQYHIFLLKNPYVKAVWSNVKIPLDRPFYHKYLYVTNSTSSKYFFLNNDMQFLPCKCLSHQQFHNEELNSNCCSYSWPKLCFRGKDLEQINLIMVPFTGCNRTGGKCKHYAKRNYTNTAHSMFTSLKIWHYIEHF